MLLEIRQSLSGKHNFKITFAMSGFALVLVLSER